MRPTLSLLVALLAAPPAAVAHHDPYGACADPYGLGRGIVELTAGRADATFYVDDRNYALGHGLWIYQETNGVWTGTDPAHDLQRGDRAHWATYTVYALTGVGGWDDTCWDDPRGTPDNLIL